MMSLYEFMEKSDEINWRHRDDPESKEHIMELMSLYKEYGTVRVEVEDSDSTE